MLTATYCHPEPQDEDTKELCLPARNTSTNSNTSIHPATSTTNSDVITTQDEQPLKSEAENLEEKIYEVVAQTSSSPDDTTTTTFIPDPTLSLPGWRKIAIATSLCLVAFILGFESSITSALVGPIIQMWHVVPPLALLNVSIFLKGWSFGTAFFGPISEAYGRQYPLSTGLFLFIVFQIPTALAKNIQTLLVSRFLTGFFGSVPLVTVYAIFGDVLGVRKREWAMLCFGTSLLVGACLGPIAGAYLVVTHPATRRNHDGWRWTEYTTIIMSFIIYLTIFIIPETCPHRLHNMRAKKMHPTNHEEMTDRAAERHRTSPKRLIDVWLNRPFIMLFTDPLLFLNTLHSALALGILYITFETFMLPFLQTRHWLRPDTSSLPPYVTMTLGILCGTTITSYFILTFITRYFEKYGKMKKPETRLLPVLLGALLLPSGLFWFAWTNSRTQHWLSQAASCIFIGAGVLLITQQSEAYTLEIYKPEYRNSVLTATVFLRSLFAAGFTMASRPMYERLHVDWATSVWGFASLGLGICPVVVWGWGERLRRRSRYVTEGQAVDGGNVNGDGREV
ncbi:MFS general substrate transporter [Lindgomyces ingoldianus]|uniref:MFS general substrate transporter n=1 Tax=Lindgomyces ingoldianus TaxID=673940 RepID=A0ACB6QLM0_9PLEO|nr:MFS general substrate transporter [Lindgomyces ingoldianus]KAF2467790.1 MFS general substrate transporter [Lindgomyces ingoldianus]